MGRLLRLLFYSIVIIELLSLRGGRRVRFGRPLDNFTILFSSSRAASIDGPSGILNTTFLAFLLCYIYFFSSFSCFSALRASQASYTRRFFSFIASSLCCLLVSFLALFIALILSFSSFTS